MNIHATIEKNTLKNILEGIPHQKIFFIIYLLKDEHELRLGMLIRLQRIYNFLLFHAIILSVLDVYGLYYGLLYYFWG